MKLFNAAQTRALEQAAVDRGAGYLELMENAGASVVRFLRKKFTLAEKKFVILCGKGNNGGDGFVAARLLCEYGVGEIVVVLVQGLPVTGEAKAMLGRLRGLPVKILNTCNMDGSLSLSVASADFILDGIYGTGFHGAAPEELEPLMEAVNRSGAVVVALDLPSGVSCDTGAAEGACIRAGYTVTFTVWKAAQLLQPAKAYCGQVYAVPIGIDSAMASGWPVTLQTVEQELVGASLPPRDPEGNKGTFGRLLCVCGSSGMAGAALLSTAAAVRCGVGLVETVLPRSIYPIVASGLPEAVYTLLEETDLCRPLQRASACLIGCGIGTAPRTEQRVLSLLGSLSVPFVLDADGINLLAGHKDVLKAVKAAAVLTPHPGEMARLLETTVEDVQAHRLEYARRFAAEYHVVLVLKGAGTITALPDGSAYLNTTGNAGMAKGGSGDVLAGMIGALLAQGMEPGLAAASAVWLHGAAGDRCAASMSQTAMLPTDLLGRLPELFLELGR